MLFADLYGQNEIKKILADMIGNDRVSHAFVFCGPTGIGRKSFAKKFAEALMCPCREPGQIEPCGTCVCCTLMENDTNPEYIVVTEDPGKKTIGVGAIRNMQEDLAKAPEYGRKKVYVIDPADKMTEEAQNALLKTIEEPPEYGQIILVCANISLLIETVRSRVVRLDFARNSDQDVLKAFERQKQQRLAAGETIPEVPDELICGYADGVIGRALEIQAYEVFLGLREQSTELLQLLPEGRVEFLLRFSQFFEKNAEYKEFLFFTMTSLLRDIMLLGRYRHDAKLQNAYARDTIQKLAGKIHYHQAVQCIQILQDAWVLLGKNVNYKLTVDSTAIKLQEALR